MGITEQPKIPKDYQWQADGHNDFVSQLVVIMAQIDKAVVAISSSVKNGYINQLQLPAFLVDSTLDGITEIEQYF